ncbi:tetratricopeptide repeat protein [Anabaena azotica]|uniref:tetratricopeptide repeat protein n=1 Tax=Anabaena azotica TaxID=197653 RepID=UPI0039A6F0FA
MSLNRAVNFACELIITETGKPLIDSEMNVLRGMLDKKTYIQIAELHQYSEGAIRDIGSDLCKKLSVSLNIKVTKNNLITIIEQNSPTEQKKISNSETLPKCNDESHYFVGRDTAINYINDRMNEGMKIIVIQAAGGVGKTTLAKQYLYNQGFDLVLPLEMAKGTENITAVESEVETWLKQYFQEEPGRDFKTTLTRLKQQLQNRKIGVFIDNLEPALDKQGRFIEKHSLYVELLRVLGDDKVQSVTLITSRERLCDDRVNGIYHYPLAVLTVEAWEEFLTSRKIKIDTPSLEAMHKIYGGNAKAMDILFGVMREDYDGDMAAYWLENSTCVETELKNLVESQFNRLQTLDNEADKLLCRLGCFRYQDVPRVSIDALLALLWDVHQDKRRDVIKALKNRCLVEFEKGEYWLHPIVREYGIERLKASGKWEEINRKAAEFWTESVKSVKTLEDGKKALEAYHHYLEINDFEMAGKILIFGRDNKWEKGEKLGKALYRLGWLQKINICISQIINQVKLPYTLCHIYNIFGNVKWLQGDINNAIKFHVMSSHIANQALDNSCDEREKIILQIMIGVSLFNQGLCKIEFGDLSEALNSFNSCLIVIKKNYNNESQYNLPSRLKYTDLIKESYLNIAFINSYLGNYVEARKFLEKSQPFTTTYNTWGHGYSLVYLGATYQKLQDTDNASYFYHEAISFAQQSNYIQVKSLALIGLAELYREQNDFKTALSHHSESIEILDKIGAKSDLAEAYYQLGLTYKKMGEPENSNTNFNEAIQLYQEMEAPKQVERVEKAKSQN